MSEEQLEFDFPGPGLEIETDLPPKLVEELHYNVCFHDLDIDLLMIIVFCLEEFINRGFTSQWNPEKYECPEEWQGKIQEVVDDLKKYDTFPFLNQEELEESMRKLGKIIPDLWS